MKVYLNRIDGIDDAIIALFVSKRNLTRDKELNIRRTVYAGTNQYPSDQPCGAILETWGEFGDLLGMLSRTTRKHITLGRFVDLSFTVYDMHRAGQDDLDSHAMRMNNRIVRSSTRLADFHQGEVSEFYEGKIIPTDVALAVLGMAMPAELEYEGKKYVRSVNGYIQENEQYNRDVKRGLYMLSIPSTFIFKINLTEFAHVYKERNLSSPANEEVRDAVEDMATQLSDATKMVFNRDLLMAIQN